MVKSCGHRLLRSVIVCAVVALLLLVAVPPRWSGTRDARLDGVGSPTDDDSAVKDFFPLLAGGDSGHLELPIGDILQPDLVPPDVHFVWCGERWFEFKNYLSVMSVRRAIQPDKIYIHYEAKPPLDRVYYHQVYTAKTIRISTVILRQVFRIFIRLRL